MDERLAALARCIEMGKIDRRTAYPPTLAGEDGADELTARLLADGTSPNAILNDALVRSMATVGEQYARGEVFVPELLMSARAAGAVLARLRPYFNSGQVRRRGTFVIGTVAGDLHDIGKNIVSMMIEGAGWEVVDLGVDVPIARFVEEIEQRQRCVVGISALLTTTMLNMAETVRAIRARWPEQVILVGGAPLSQEFAERIGASFYSPDPQRAVEYLNSTGGGRCGR